jgi:hypothetical protein
MMTAHFRHFGLAVLLICAIDSTLALLRAAEDSDLPPPPRPTLAKPLLIGQWADIAVLKDGADYYLVHSSGWYRPAVFQLSKNWRDGTLQP